MVSVQWCCGVGSVGYSGWPGAHASLGITVSGEGEYHAHVFVEPGKEANTVPSLGS